MAFNNLVSSDFKSLFLFNVYECLSAYMYAYNVYARPTEELELWMVGSCHGGAGNQT